MIDWKHPELALETARYLKEKNLEFRMDIIGDGEMRGAVEELRQRYGLEENVGLPGYQPPEKVRRYMEKADIFLFTSDRQEGWGAVANEAMNSACALVADHMIGAVPYLVRNGENGLIYQDGKADRLFAAAERLVRDRAYARELGKAAYRTIVDVWNAENAAERLLELIESLTGSAVRKAEELQAAGKDGYVPCAPAGILSERFRMR